MLHHFPKGAFEAKRLISRFGEFRGSEPRWVAPLGRGGDRFVRYSVICEHSARCERVVEIRLGLGSSRGNAQGIQDQLHNSLELHRRASERHMDVEVAPLVVEPDEGVSGLT